jgi:chromosomal replication initiation ATPase DnaA
MYGQPRLFDFGAPPPAAEATLVTTACNAQAWRRLTVGGGWAGGALALVGPARSGKTHLATAWATSVGAAKVSACAGQSEALALFHESGGRLWFDDVDAGLDDETLFLILDLARARMGAVLLCAAQPPARWPARSADLASRLAGLPMATVDTPDEAMLGAVLRQSLRLRYLELTPEAAAFLARRIERSYDAAAALAHAIDQGLSNPRHPIGVEAALRATAAAAPEIAMGLNARTAAGEEADGADA